MRKLIFLSLISATTILNAAEIKLQNFYKNCDQIINKQYISICYDYEKKSPRIVSYIVNGENVDSVNLKERVEFYEEELIPLKFRTNTNDYTRSGYDRGHLAPDADFDFSIKSLEETYSMANIVPMTPTLNRKVWLKGELYERLVAAKLGKVNVINVVEFSQNIRDRKIGYSQLSIPKKFYKIIYNQSMQFTKCFEFSNIDYDTDGDRLEEHEIDCNRFY